VIIANFDIFLGIFYLSPRFTPTIPSLEVNN